MVLIGRIGRPGKGRLVFKLDEDWVVVWDEIGQTYWEPQPIQSFIGKLVGDIDLVDEPDIITNQVIGSGGIPFVPAADSVVAPPSL